MDFATAPQQEQATRSGVVSSASSNCGLFAGPKHCVGCPGAVVASANIAFRRQVMDSIRRFGCPPAEASGGAEGLAELEKGQRKAFFLDHWLPDLQVQELIQIVQARHPQMDIILFNSETDKWPPSGSAARQSSEQPPLQTLHPSDPSPPPAAETGKRFTAASISRHCSVQPAKKNLPLFDVSPPVPPGPLAEDDGVPARLASPAPRELLPGLIGGSPAMAQVCRLAHLVAPRNTAVLLLGETGTGKELVARALHQFSPRAHRSLVVVNCAAIPETLLEAELFGYVRGAFTGAVQSRLGRIHAAQGGTLFLDEVGELPASMQVKLLRFLQEGEVQRLGAPDIFRVDVRVIAATNADLAQRVAQGHFRSDLYYRLLVFPIELSPLRERQEDILPLAEHFLKRLCQQAGVPLKRLTAAAMRLLSQYHWPGNVRELQHAMERAVILAAAERYLDPSYFSFPFH